MSPDGRETVLTALDVVGDDLTQGNKSMRDSTGRMESVLVAPVFDADAFRAVIVEQEGQFRIIADDINVLVIAIASELSRDDRQILATWRSPPRKRPGKRCE